MTSIPHKPVVGPADHAGHDHHDEGSYLAGKGSLGKTVWSWIYTIDHKRIGVMYLIATLFAFFLGGVFALLFRVDLLTPESGPVFGPFEGTNPLTGEAITLTANNLYNRAFTLHGALMTFAFIVPAIPAALGNFFLPMMIGAKDVAFPRLNLLSWYIYFFGSILFLTTLLWGGVETGWTFYTPYSTTTPYGATALATFSVFILGFSSILTGLNFIVTVHKLRQPGMGWFDMPLFVWASYATAIIAVLATPVIGVTTLLLTLEVVFKIGIFDPALGGDPVLYQHFFWFYSHPVVYVMILPAFGIISDVIATHARKKIFGYRFVAFSSLAIAGISFLVWGHHMFAATSEVAAAVFSGLTFLVAIPTAIKVFAWVATLYKGSIAFNTPMMYALAFLFLFTIGGLTGPPLATLASDLHLHDTYFVVAHFHYVMMGGTVIGLLAGLFHWWPKMFGKMYNETAGLIGCALVFIGFNLTFFTQFWLGTNGMPRRYATYVPEFQPLHVLSTIGSWILAAGLFLHLFTFIWSLAAGKKAPANPWGSLTTEWDSDSPPITHNFHHEPVCTHGPYDYDDVVPPRTQPGDWPLPEPLPEGAKAH